MYPKIENWSAFCSKVAQISRLICQSVQGLLKRVHLISMDEKTGIQALSRASIPCRPGRLSRPEFEYRRNGTTTLIAGQDVSTGKLVHNHLGQTRNEADFLSFCQGLSKQYPPEDELIFLVDQLNTHLSASLVEWVSEQIGFTGELGEKGKSGILQSKATRKAFLEEADHRIRFVYTPKHCSWLNPIENWFGKLQRQVLTGGIFWSVEELEQKIEAYIQYYNEVDFKPLNWKFKGFNKNKILEYSIIVET